MSADGLPDFLPCLFASVLARVQWQTAFLLFVVAWLLIAMIRGWINGFFRQLLVPLALVFSVFLVWNFCGDVARSIETIIQLPPIGAMMLAAVILWFGAFNAIMLIGRLLFKRTRDCSFDLLRWLYGSGGALIGLVYGLISLWLIVLSIRVLGRMATEQVVENRGMPPNQIVLNLAQLDQSIEMGPGRSIIDLVDPIPRGFYELLQQAGRLASDPNALRRFAGYPGFRRLLDSPGLRSLEKDPDLLASLRDGRILDVFMDSRVIGLLNDPNIRELLSGSQIEAALHFAGEGTQDSSFIEGSTNLGAGNRTSRPED